MKITFTEEIKFGDKVIDAIEVKPLSFLEMANLWTKASGRNNKREASFQRDRITFQAHFMSSGKRVTPEAEHITSLPINVAKQILAAVDLDQGLPGTIIQEGDGSIKPVLYKLGTPLKAKTGKGEDVEISEIEFQAKTYGEIEDVLAAENEIMQAVALLRTVAKPVMSTGSLMALPGWALDRITPADGVTIMKKVLPSF